MVDELWLTRFLLQRALAFVYLISFLVTANQFRALLGERGLLPVPDWLRGRGWSVAPSLFQIRYSERFAMVLAWSGVALSVLALSGLSESFGTPVSMAVWFLLWGLYLSFVNVGQTWYAFGWETLLLEAGFLAIFLGGAGTEPPEVVVWLYRWLLFRVMFGAGLIKMRGDPCWRDLTCLFYHYETQPLPNPLSWFLHRSPRLIHKAGVAFTHLVQLVVPFGYFLPAPVSWMAGGFTVLFQGSLILSGNLSWLNHLTLVLAIACFDDQALSWLPLDVPSVGPRALPHEVLVWGLIVMVAVLSWRPVRNLFRRRQLMNASFEPYHLVNTYGAFGSITRERFEIVIEGCADPDRGPGSEWREYEFKAKPGRLDRRPPIVAPYHLRLDWLMWFAAMGTHRQHPWFVPLLVKLLAGDPATLGLLGRNPFPDGPPAAVRARLYLYRFTTAGERRETGDWWKRELVGEYVPAIGLG